MKTFFFTTLAVVTLPFFLASDTFAQTVSPCGNVYGPVPAKYTESYPSIVEQPITDCDDPFTLTTEYPLPYTLHINQTTVADGGTIAVPEGKTRDYQITGQGILNNVQPILYKHEGQDLRYVEIRPSEFTDIDLETYVDSYFTSQGERDFYRTIVQSNDKNQYFYDENGEPLIDEATGRYINDRYYEFEYDSSRKHYAILPEISEGTYTLLLVEYMITFNQVPWYKKLADLIIPTAHAITPQTNSPEYRFAIDFTITKAQEEPTGASSVLFLPGIMGSRLYEDADGCNTTGEGQERWLSLSVCDQLRLMMGPTGNSINDIYTKPGESSILVSQVYKTFFDSLADWKSQQIIEDYVAVPYDWRLGLDSLLKAKVDNTGKIRFDVTSSVQEGYLYQTLAQLAEGSYTGKVTIVTHSNGGLLAKALLATLDRDNDPLADKVDVLIMVAPPQLGTPDALVGILHGSRISPYLLVGNVVSQKTSRQLLGTMPFAHHLLPSSQYFNSSGVTVETPVLTFDAGSLTTPWATTYGNRVTTAQGMQAFMQTSSGRVVPSVDDLNTPAVVSGTQFSYANSIHLLMNAWVPASTTKVYQIAGVGVQTVLGIRYYTGRECGVLNPLCLIFNPKILYQVQHTIDGDGTVVTPSALAMSESSSNVERRWLNIDAYNRSGVLNSTENKDHGTVFDINEVNMFIKDILELSTTTNYQYISKTPPNITNEDRLDFYLHSPLDMTIKLSNGTEISSSSPETNLGMYRRYGELQYISVPNTANNKVLSLKGTATGSFTLEIEEYKNGSTTKRQTYSAIPSSTSTLVTVSLTDSTSLPSVILSVDYDGNGSVDSNYNTNGLVITYTNLYTAINSLSIAPLYKKIILETAKIAEQNYNKSLTNSKFKKAEKLSLNVLKQQVLLYGKLKIISLADQQKIVSIIDNLLNK